MTEEPCHLIYGYSTFEEEPRWYVGSTSDERQQARMKEHERLDGSAEEFHDFLRAEMSRTGKVFYEIVKYRVLGICYGSLDDRRELENYWIIKKNARRRGFNGGLAGGMPDWTDPIMRAKHAENTSKARQREVENGSHHWLGENHPNANGKVSKRLVEEGKHNWQTEEHRENTSKRVREEIANGTHIFQTNHPLKNPEIDAKRVESLKQTCFQKRESKNQTSKLKGIS